MTTGVPNVLEGTNIPDDFFIPPCGIEDLDRALFYLFDRRLAFTVDVNSVAKKVPVVFSTGERFALTRREPPMRDRDNAFILPIIAIKRNAINFDPGLQGYGTPIANRDQAGYYIKRKLSKSDRNYQKLINKLRLKNQDNVASRKNFLDNNIFPGDGSDPGTIASRRNQNNLSFLDDETGKLLRNSLGENIYEIIEIPYPKFILANYEITFWTQYTIHMNQLLESLIARFDGQEKGYKIQTDSGYEFVAYFQTQFTPADNFSDFSSEERIIKYTFEVKVPGFILASQEPGMPSPFKRYLTAPQLEFGFTQISAQATKLAASPATGDIIGGDSRLDRFILSDVDILDKNGHPPLERGQTGTELVDLVSNPFTGKTTPVFSRVRTRNQRSGETVASANITVELETQIDPITD